MELCYLSLWFKYICLKIKSGEQKMVQCLPCKREAMSSIPGITVCTQHTLGSSAVCVCVCVDSNACASSNIQLHST